MTKDKIQKNVLNTVSRRTRREKRRGTIWLQLYVVYSQILFERIYKRLVILVASEKENLNSSNRDESETFYFTFVPVQFFTL